MMNHTKITTKQLGVSAVLLSLAVVSNFIAPITLPYGGTLSFCTMLFICLVGYLFGVRLGVIAGIAFGLLDLVLAGFVFHPIQVLLDYPIAFGLLGIIGLFRNYKFGLFVGYIVAVAARYVIAVISGVVFFGSFAPEGTPVLWYSITYNASYIVPEMILSLVIISVPAVRKALLKVQVSLLEPNQNQVEG